MAPTAHVLHVVEDLESADGDPRFTNLVAGLKHFRHSVAGYGRAAALTSRFDGAGVTVVPMSTGLPALFQLARYLRRQTPQLLHSRGGRVAWAQSVAMLAGVGARVHSEHESAQISPNTLNPRWRGFVQHFVGATRAIEKRIVSELGVEPGRVSQIYDCAVSGAATTEPARLRATSEMVGPMQIAAMDETADVVLLQVFAQVLRTITPSTFRVRLAVPAANVEVARGKAQELGLGMTVTIQSQREELLSAMSDAALFVCDARGASHAMVLQAMQLGLPTVATLEVSNAELVVPGQTGELTVRGDSDAMTKAVQDYIQQLRRRNAHGRAAYLRATQHFSAAAMVNRYTALYQTLLLRSGLAPEVGSAAS